MSDACERPRTLRAAAAGALVLAAIAIGAPATASANATTATSLVAPTPTQGYGQDAPEAGDEPPTGSAPADPIDPSGPTDSTVATDSSDPTDSTDPTGSTEPTDTPTPSDTPTQTDAPTPTSTPTPTPTGHPKPLAPPLVVTIDFDDGTADQFQTAALLAARQMAGVYYLNSGRVGLSGTYMTAGQITQLQADGNEIGGHTVFHLHLPQQSIDEQLRQICTDRDQLIGLGLRVTDLAFPFGEFTPASQAAAEQCGYNSVRTSEGATSGTDTIPPANPYELKALSSLGSTTTTAYITAAVKKAEADRGGLLQLVFHRVCTQAPCRDNAIQIEVFNQVLDWLAAQRSAGHLQVKTVAQVIGGPLRPTVAAPRSTAILGVPNPSFEQGSSVPDVPTCWEHTVNADNNVATWSLTQDAHSGQWAEHLDASSLSGGVGLVVTQDEGTCTSPAVPAHRYTYSVWYKSSAPVRLVSYRRLPTGGYRTYGLTVAFPASPNKWTDAIVTTRPMPAGTTGISIGVSIQAAGHFTFDDFALADAGPLPPKPHPTSTRTTPAPIARDDSTPSAAPVTIPVVAVAQSLSSTRGSAWSGIVWIGAVLLFLAMTLAMIDWRLGRIRRGSRSQP